MGTPNLERSRNAEKSIKKGGPGHGGSLLKLLLKKRKNGAQAGRGRGWALFCQRRWRGRGREAEGRKQGRERKGEPEKRASAEAELTLHDSEEVQRTGWWRVTGTEGQGVAKMGHRFWAPNGRPKNLS